MGEMKIKQIFYSIPMILLKKSILGVHAPEFRAYFNDFQRDMANIKQTADWKLFYNRRLFFNRYSKVFRGIRSA